MKRFFTSATKYLPLITAIVLPLVMFVPVILQRSSVSSQQEQMITNLLRLGSHLTIIRSAAVALIVINLVLIYWLCKNWFGARRAALSVLLLSCIPLFLLIQYSIVYVAVALTAILVAFVAFDNAGRSNKPAGWYALAGFAITAAWIQEPIGTTLILFICSVLLMAAKPKYIKHIARQSSLIPIILIVVVGVLTGASIKYHFGFQDYMVAKLTTNVHLAVNYQFLLKGPSSYRFGLPGAGLVPLAVMVLAGLGGLQLISAHKRPRNKFIVALPVVLLATSLIFNGVTGLVLLAVALIAVAIWAANGVQYLYASWRQLFPHNKLANRTAVIFLSAMMASLVLYSYWYVARGWLRSPQHKIDIVSSWDGSL